MHWSASPIISTSYVHTFILKVIKWDGLVSLCRNMDYVDPIIIACLNVGPKFQKQVAKCRIPFKWSKVKGCKAICCCFKVYPFCDSRWCQSLCRIFYQQLNERFEVLEASFMQECITTFIYDVRYRHICIDFQTSYDSCFIAFLDVGEGLIDNVFNLYLCFPCLLDFI